MTPDLVLFYGLAAVSLLSAVAAVGIARTLVGSGLSLGVTLLSLSGIYVLLHAELVAVAQLLVQGVALLVLLLFVVALRADRAVGLRSVSPRARLAIGFGAAAAVGLGGFALLRLFASLLGVVPESSPPAAGLGGFHSLGIALYGPFAIPVELVALVLTAAALGVFSLTSGSRGATRESDRAQPSSIDSPASGQSR